jgi:hypothetical protein
MFKFGAFIAKKIGVFAPPYATVSAYSPRRA